MRPTYNVLDGDLEAVEWPNGRRWRSASLGASLGAERIGMSAYELPPGGRFFPYHYHYANEEWLLVLAGAPTLRSHDAERVLSEGDLVCFARGPEGAHTLRNDAETPARFLMASTNIRPDVVVYPDSDKIGVRPGGRGPDTLNLPRAAALDYWDGE